MPNTPSQILQLKITLLGIRPPIWRRLLIPADATFWDLHVALQDAMGWTDTHLHEFSVGSLPGGRRLLIGADAESLLEDPTDESASTSALLSWQVPLSAHLGRAMQKIRYVYDFGDYWDHVILLEKVLLPEPGRRYPQCVAGRRACPPEDCGGPPGYGALLEALADPADEQHDEYLEWVGEEFDPDWFDPSEVVFDDPAERLRELLDGTDIHG